MDEDQSVSNENQPRRRLDVRDPRFVDIIRGLLDAPDDDSISESEVDDSDNDPDFILPGREGQGIVDESSEEEDDVLLEEDVLNEPVPIQANEAAREEIFFIERTKKTELIVPNAWTNKPPPRNVRTPARNIIRGLPGLRGRARTLGNQPSKKEVWQLLFDDIIMDMILVNTNVKLEAVRAGLSVTTKKNNYRDTDLDELNALFGLLLASSVLSSNEEKITSVFTKDPYSRPIYSATMSIKRFEILLMCLRFDDARTRNQRRLTEKAAPISEIFGRFIENSKRSYSVSSEVTIDEMLVPFRGRCGFKVFMPKKPKKYGIKVMCLCDAKTSYLLNAYIYTGKGSDSVGLNEAEKNLAIPTQSVVRLCQPIINSNKNVTADNWFSSLEVVDELLKRNLTFVGTVKKDKKAIPEEFLQNPVRPVRSSLYGFRDKTTLLSYVPKKNRAVILISSMHHSIEVNEDKRKPEIIAYYNATKCGVDIMDMKCAIYNSSRRTRRWPLAMFYRMLNIGSVNSFILYLSYQNSPIQTRFEFIKQLSFDLIKPHLQKRYSLPSLQRTLKEDIKRVLGDDVPAEERRRQGEGDGAEAGPSDRLEKRKTCATCPSAKKRKTAYKCIVCSKPICLECGKKVCLECAKEVVS